MTALQNLLNSFRSESQTEREKGTYFELLTILYLKNEASYQDLYSNVWTYAEWAESQGLPKNDAGIDLVAKTRGTDEFHAIQCKFYAEDYRVQKSDIDSFFTASGKKYFTHRIIVTTTNNWSQNAEDALNDQNPPISKIDLNDLENSQIDWSQFQPNQAPVIKPKKTLRPHQTNALNAVKIGLCEADRGKLIMACGTGKTFTGLKIAEELAGKGKRVLFLVPSLSLLSQTLTEWTQESTTPLHSFAVCSDSDVGKKRKNEDDLIQTVTHELRYPATTEPSRLALEMEKRHDADHMSVVYSTYHSIDVISRAQKEHSLNDFDLIICDEAHRTTGATFDDADESNFVKVHDASFIKASKRIYMTATPRIYGEVAKVSAEKDNVALCSMDDEKLYGKELFVINFSEAVRLDLLVDYKVIVLAVEETHINRRLQLLLSDENNQLKVDDAAKIIGCWKALSKQDTQEDLTTDPDPMRRAVAFCQVIEPSIQGKSKTHKVSSKNIAGMFSEVVEAYKKQELAENPEAANEAISLKLNCEAEHIDGGMNASQKEEKLNWLKAEPDVDTCRILSNVRCLSEGVDVPALDAVLFLTPRNSQVDVVQSVGRVMRKAEGKKRGYVILPVVIPAGVEPHEALNDNVTYKVVWQVLQALRSHDDRFDAMVNKLDLIGRDTSKMEVIAVTDKIASKAKKSPTGETTQIKNPARGKRTIGNGDTPTPQQVDLQFEIGEIERAIYAKVVQKCGNRSHWEDWAKDIAKIAKTHIDRIRSILGLSPDTPENKDQNTVLPDPAKPENTAFLAFAEELKDDLNDSITHTEMIEMLAQHLITKPVFDALFEGYSFASKNPMSLAMQDVLDVLQEHNIDKEADTLQRFYDSVKMRASGIDSASAKQKIVVELYDKFFRNAFPKMTERLGIIYTPVEVVDFIIHSVNDVLKNEFGQTLGSENVHIIDPFTGTGTFITRLLQSGLISKEQLAHKYKNEIHANELVLLAYYIAAINIESIYHDLMSENGDVEYEPFEGICLTDTFQLHEKDDLISELLVDNSARRVKQKSVDLRVIIGNPPYSVGQDNANDNNANINYPFLDKRIEDTYVNNTDSTNKNGLYNSYIRAIRWASDRIGNSGVIGFITNAGFLDGSSGSGIRKCLYDEFTTIYSFNLRGNIRGKSGDVAKKEGQNVFDIITGVAINILVKNPNKPKSKFINYKNIGDYLTKKDKLEIISGFKSISGITTNNEWALIEPDYKNDWLRQRVESFDKHIKIGDKKGADSIFTNYSSGLKSQRDNWCYNSSKSKLAKNIKMLISEFNEHSIRFKNDFEGKSKKEKDSLVDSFINTDLSKIKWSDGLKESLIRGEVLEFQENKIVEAVYRPFGKCWLYYDKRLNERTYQMPTIFPSGNEKNITIVVKSNWQGVGEFALAVSNIIDIQSDGGCQCFSLRLFNLEKKESPQKSIFAQSNLLEKNSSISDYAYLHFQKFYNNNAFEKDDIFYYIYGLLHSNCLKEQFSDNLSKELPRIPCVNKLEDFWAFSKAGRDLAELHINYETVAPYPVNFVGGNAAISMLDDTDLRVTQMKFANKADKSTVIYNSKITMTDIPLEAYEYVINGKPALEWVMERQAVTTHKDSGIVNDANDWAIETMGNLKYPLELFQRVITVSIETMKIVNALPKLDI
jgi:predicted helicase